MTKIKLASLIVAGTLLGSCGDGFLDLKPISNATTSLYYNTADDFRTALNGAYASLQKNGVFLNSYVFGDVPSDNTLPVSSGSVTDQDEFDRFYIKTTNPYISERWNDSYAAIARCNTILNRIGAISMDEALRSRYILETKFLRALVYFNLVRTYGDVPLVLKEITNSDEGYAYGRNPLTEVYAQIEADLTDAEGLPVSYTGADIGRATKGAAKAILGKVYMTEGKTPAAVAKLKEVIDLNVYAILPSYADVFKVSNKNNKESIFDVQFKSGLLGEGNPWPNSFAPQNSGNAVIAFGGDGNNTPTTDLESAYEANDLRKNISMASSYVNAAGATIPYYYVKKFMDVPAAKNDNGNNIPVIRYADVLLLYAEALNEVGYVADGDAFTHLNTIRTRAGLDALSSTELPDQESFRLAVEQERRVELAFEGHRWFDLVRTNRAIDVMNSKKALFNIIPTLTTDNLVFPIPQSQILINKEKILQNKGY
ncbi:RagB/SusD family nutrient uptake outer membrane protein [Chryseolinea lacunae]|uniref:RagB/SusD family nutrient uptake outer membrane protein n=1 Tax=Chryseolinea lacunae TaxID=2801331 RepID=A0ABS1L2D9_9BACT|nr:RagB/SusD family nutrient uptake outer membrane protein [Chryseolinea lacunae]MBL0744711.1 RagB/SusD family nutrient uptake outer membrane protein [Chryseolinea lacunae]